MSANTMDAEVGLAKIAASVLRCLVFTAKCYQIVIAPATQVTSSRQVMPSSANNRAFGSALTGGRRAQYEGASKCRELAAKAHLSL